jgi:uncharacterized RDD family membrane protein YckC
MSTPVPEFPDASANTTAFSFGGYAVEPVGLVGVGFWPRVAARLIDSALHYCVSYAGGYMFRIMLIAAAGGHIPLWVAVKFRHLGLSAYALGMLSFFVYNAVCVSVHGSTLGKRLLSMVVVHEDGTPCGVKSAIIRELAYYVDALFFGLIGYLAMEKSGKEQRYGDQWAETVVCKRSSLAPEQLQSDGRFALALMLAMMADAGLNMVGLLVFMQ